MKGRQFIANILPGCHFKSRVLFLMCLLVWIFFTVVWSK